MVRNFSNEFNFRQVVTTDTFSYADTSALVGNYGISGGMLLNKYHINGSKVIDKVNVYISGNNTIGAIVYGVILDANGVLLSVSPNDTIIAADTSSMMSFNVYDASKSITNADFYGGIAIVNSSLNLVGIQAENPVSPDSYYKLNNLIGGQPISLANQLSGRLQIEAVVTNPITIDVAIGVITNPYHGCGLGNETVTIEIQNAGFDTLKGGFTASYQLTGMPIVNESVTDTIAPGNIKLFSFSSPVNLTSNIDTAYELRAWVNKTTDIIQTNDTSNYYYVVSKYSAGTPTAVPATVNYGQVANLGAIPSTPPGTIKWYANPSGGSSIAIGNSFLTQVLFDTVTYYIEAVNTNPVDLKITEVSVLNSGIGHTTNYPSYFYSTSNSTDFVEITNMGYNQVNLSGYQFKIYDPSSVSNVETYTFPYNTVLPAEAVLVLDVRSSGYDIPQLNYYLLNFTVDIQPTHQQALALYKPNGTIVDAVVLGNNNYTDSTAISGINWNGILSPTISVAGYYRHFSDYNTADNWIWASATDPLTIGTINPDLGLSIVSGACSPNQRVPVVAYVQNIPQNESGISQIVSPSGNLLGGSAYNIDVKIKNFGLSNLTSATINWSVNGVLQSPFSWTGNLQKDSSENAIIGSYIFTGGTYNISSWTTLPNGVQDSYPNNDLASIVVTSCMSGTLTIGDTTGGNYFDFLSINDAVQVMSTMGICGPVVFEIDSGIYNTNTIIIPVISGNSAVNTITFKSSTGDYNDVLISTTDDDLFKISGADYVRIENLHLKNSIVGSSGSRIIYTLNSCNDIRIKGCKLEGETPQYIAQKKYDIIVSDEYSQDSLVLDSNIFLNGIIAVNMYAQNIAQATLQYLNKGLIARNNKCIGQRQVFLIKNSKIIIIDNNNITDFERDAIKLYPCQNTVPGGIYFQVVSNNILSNSSYSTGLYFYDMSGTAVNPNIIANNMINVGNMGIDANRSNHINVYNNTVNIQVIGGTLSRCFSTLNAIPALVGVNVANNIFTMKGNGYCMKIFDNAGPSGYTFQNNNYYADDSLKLGIGNFFRLCCRIM